MSFTPTAALNHIPAEVRCAHDYETLAQRHLAAPSYAYIAGGSATDHTVAANRNAFDHWAIYPRLLRDVRTGHTGLTLAGQHYPHPIWLAPVAFHVLAHPGAEIETARAAHAVDTCMIASTLASRTLEQVAAAAGPRRWFQLYLQARREDTLDLIRRAEAAGYQALVLTLDAPIQVASHRTLASGFQLPSDCHGVNLQGYASATPPAGATSRIFQGPMQHAPSWDDIAWLQRQTRLPLWAKGVLHPDDALALRDAGIDGIMVSNHGGRGLDGAPASLAMLPAIRAAVGPDYPLIFDGGIRSGSDVFKALALGANGAAIGRLQLYALSVAGALGVAHMLTLLREELEVCMALAGCASVDQINRSTLFSTTGHPC